jgi:hypothetical protein
VGTVDAALDFWNFFLFGFAQARLLRRLRVDTFGAVLAQNVPFFDSHTSGELTGKPAKLTDVPVDGRATLTFSLDRKTVIALQAGERRGDGERPVRPGVRDGDRPAPGRAATTKATLIDFDAGKSTINLLVGAEADPQIKTLSIGKDVTIKLQYGERPFADLKLTELAKPLNVLVQFADDQKSVKAITVMAPTVRGVVKSVDAAGRKITVAEGRETTKTYSVVPGAILRGFRKEIGGLGEIDVGANVLLSLTPNRQGAIGVAVMPVRRGDPER